MPPGGGTTRQSLDVPALPERQPTDVERLVVELRRQLTHLERVLGSDLPAAQRRAREVAGEERWPVTVAVAVAILLQATLSGRLALGPSGLIVGLEAALGIALLIANPRRINRRSRVLRVLSIALVALTSLANAWSSYALIRAIVVGDRQLTAVSLLASGGAIYLTNIIVFGLWYWEWESGGPVERAHRGRTSSSPRTPEARRSRPAGRRPSPTTCTCPTPTRPPSAPPTRCRSAVGRSC